MPGALRPGASARAACADWLWAGCQLPTTLEKLGFGESTVDEFKSSIVHMRELNYAGRRHDADDARALASILASFGKMVDFQTIDLSNNPIGNVGMTAIAQVILNISHKH